jgi:DNA polymerase-1
MISRIILVDALGMIYRAFYAVAGLATSTGRPTNAVFGFIRMLSQINRVWRPTHELVVFDGGIPEARKKILPRYKAQRPPMPDQLRAQLPDVEEYLAAAMIKSVRLEGREADDILASAAARADSAGLETFVATSDKDLMQVVGGQIAMVSPGKIEEKIGPEEIIRKTGVKPSQIVEWLALVGDSADNIPGIPGIGAKTAARLLNEFGSLGEIFNHLDRIKSEKTRAGLEAGRADVLRNVDLITLDKGIDLPFATDDLALRMPDKERLRSFYGRMEFHSLAAGL